MVAQYGKRQTSTSAVIEVDPERDGSSVGTGRKYRQSLGWVPPGIPSHD